ncbi:MAG: endosialidase [Clostridiales bacterium]|nr:endosialidase [Clostridiales bacterium]
MAVIEELIRKESDGTISFGNFKLGVKSKLSDFEHQGDLYKVKTFHEITKLEKNGSFVYESVPGTAVFNFNEKDDVISFQVAGTDTAQITLEMEAEKEYKIFRDDISLGKMKTNLGGKLVFSLELNEEEKAHIKVVKL